MDQETVKLLKQFLISGKYPGNYDKSQRYSLRRKASNYCVIDNQLYYKKHRGTEEETNVKEVCSASEADAVFREFHASNIGAHCGQVKTRDAISQRFYWPGMSAGIEKWVSECTVCQKNKREIKAGVDYKPITVKTPFELVGMDLIGKLVKTDQGYQYIAVLLDYCTRWAQAYPLRSKRAAEVTQTIMKFVYQFEVPKRILTDQGKEFVNDYADKLLAGEPLTFPNSTRTITKYRREVAMRLLQGTDDLRELCHCCGEKIQEDTQPVKTGKGKGFTIVWIQCDNCHRWYHLSCMSEPDISKLYTCPACV